MVWSQMSLGKYGKWFEFPYLACFCCDVELKFSVRRLSLIKGKLHYILNIYDVLKQPIRSFLKYNVLKNIINSLKRIIVGTHFKQSYF